MYPLKSNKFSKAFFNYMKEYFYNYTIIKEGLFKRTIQQTKFFNIFDF